MSATSPARKFQTWLANSQSDVDAIASMLAAAGLCDIARRGDGKRLQRLHDAYYDLVMAELRRCEEAEACEAPEA
jgi:hypothetical protein